MFTSHLLKHSQAAQHKACIICPLVLLMAVLAGCGPGPGAPLVRTSSGDGDGDGPLIPGCQNVSSSDASLLFNPNSYLTTWGSASREGGAAGKYEAARQVVREFGVDSRDEDLRAFAYGSLPDSAIFCRVYNAAPQTIYKIVENMISEFGYRWEYRNRREGLLSTDYVYRAHKVRKPSAKWKDRFFVDIKPLNASQSIVRINRDVYIARRTKEGWSDYIKGTSVGYNEAVILNRIAQKL